MEKILIILQAIIQIIRILVELGIIKAEDVPKVTKKLVEEALSDIA
jgi:hypothetical protein